MLKYLNYTAYIFIIIYIFGVYISLKFNYLYNLRFKLLNYYINKYNITLKNKDINRARELYLVTVQFTLYVRGYYYEK